MERELRDAMQAGAIGFTTSRTDQHETSDDRPVASAARVVGRGLPARRRARRPRHRASSRSRPSSTAAWTPTERDAVLDAMRDLAVESSVPMTFGVGSGRRLEEMLRPGRRHRGRRRPHVRPDPQPRHLGRALVPEPHALRSPPRVAARCARCPRTSSWRRSATESLRRKLVDAATPRRLRACHRRRGAASPTTTRMRVFDRPVPPNPTVAEAAAERGLDPSS